MIYGVDVDGVLAQTTEAVLDYLRDLHGYELRLEQVTSFHWEDWCPDQWVIDEVTEIFGSEIFYQALEPVVGAVEGVQALRASARSLVAITSRPTHCREATEDWLMAWGFDGIRRVVCTDDKVAVAKHYGVKVMVEDAPHHALALAQHGIPVYLLDYPWNQGTAHPLIHRVRGWAEIMAAETARQEFRLEKIGLSGLPFRVEA